MRKTTLLAVGCALALSACTSIRVSGFVTDRVTGEPVGSCGVSFGGLYSSCDLAGHYTIKGRKSWTSMQVVAPGYEPQAVPVDASKTRLPVVHVQMVPKKTGKEAHAGR